MRLIRIEEGRGGKPRINTGDGAGVVSNLSQPAALGVYGSCLWVFMVNCHGCFTREENGSWRVWDLFISLVKANKERQCLLEAVLQKIIIFSLYHLPSFYENQSSLEQARIRTGPELSLKSLVPPFSVFTGHHVCVFWGKVSGEMMGKGEANTGNSSF